MQKFYKYRGNVDIYSEKGLELFERDMKMISDNEIWCSKLNDLNDPFEGEYKMNLFNKNLSAITTLMSYLRLKKKSTEVNQKFSNAVQKIFDLSVQISGIYSLTTNYKNDLMWAHYSNSHLGYCIEYEFENLKDFDIKYQQLPSHLNHFDKVNYSEKSFNLNKINVERVDILKFLFQKSIKWNYEEEWRIVTFISGKFTYNQDCIKSIIFGLKASDEIINLVTKKLQVLNIEFYKMKKIDSYLIEKEKI